MTKKSVDMDEVGSGRVVIVVDWLPLPSMPTVFPPTSIVFVSRVSLPATTMTLLVCPALHSSTPYPIVLHADALVLPHPLPSLLDSDSLDTYRS